ncbi:MAG TPA: ABC transporter substrate-binding protein, partial [Clostridia bacterium]|nr:ABC transporter substrate-binding protein [Clostridia bacterium]
DYYDLGYATGLMAHKVLTGQTDIASMPIEYAPKFTKLYNQEICESLGLTMPDDYQPISD